MATSTIQCRKTRWKGRAGYCLTNDLVQLTTLVGGGAVADLRCRCGDQWSPNLLWEAPWPTMDPRKFQSRHTRQYGPPFVGKFLASFTGHVLCLDYFGAPSDEEIQRGLTLHGEACAACWKVTITRSGMAMESRLSAADLHVRRKMSVVGGESVIYVQETVSNPRPVDHFLHWVQHVTLGPPFLSKDESVVDAPAFRGKTWPHGYEGKSLLSDDREFDWPLAPAEDGGSADLSHPFLQSGKGFVATVLFDVNRRWAFVTVLNSRLGLLLGFCFSRSMCPWLTLWEENRARSGAPWKGKTQARGLEFGTTPFPVGRQATFRMGSLLGEKVFTRVPAMGMLQSNYAIFVTPVSPEWKKIQDVQVEQGVIGVVAGNGERICLAAKKISKIGAV